MTGESVINMSVYRENRLFVYEIAIISNVDSELTVQSNLLQILSN